MQNLLTELGDSDKFNASQLLISQIKRVHEDLEASMRDADAIVATANGTVAFHLVAFLSALS